MELFAPGELAALLQFTSFLLRHLPSINPYFVVLVHHNKTLNLANYVAVTLAGFPIQSYNLDTMNPKTVYINENVLLINFLPRDQEYGRIVVKPMSRYIVAIIRQPMRYSFLPRNLDRHYKPFDREIEVHAYTKPITLTSWYARAFIGRGMAEGELMRTFAWSAFMNKVRKLPAENLSLSFLDRIWTNGESIETNKYYYKQHEMGKYGNVFGLNVGIYKIIAEQLTDSKMNFMFSFHFPMQHPTVVRSLDSRLTYPYIEYSMESDRMVSLGTFPTEYIQVFIYSPPTRFVVIVPRIVENTSSDVIASVLLKLEFIVGLVVCVVFFVAQRYFCQLVNNRTSVTGWNFLIHSFFDTFSRTLGIAPGTWLGQSIAERLLLSVISVFAFLSGSIFSGVLYEQLLSKNELRFRYNNLEDVCRDGLFLIYPIELDNFVLTFLNDSNNLYEEKA